MKNLDYQDKVINLEKELLELAKKYEEHLPSDEIITRIISCACSMSLVDMVLENWKEEGHP